MEYSSIASGHLKGQVNTGPMSDYFRRLIPPSLLLVKIPISMWMYQPMRELFQTSLLNSRVSQPKFILFNGCESGEGLFKSPFFQFTNNKRIDKLII